MNRVQISVFFWIGLLVLVFIFLTPLAAGQEGLDLALEIISPSNGEIFYASHLGYIVAIPITGRVTVTEGSAEGSVEEVEVQLAIQSTHSAPLKMSATPDENGFFIFHLDLNPDNLPLPSVGERFFDYSVNCPDCHFSSDAALPLGEVILTVTAVHPQGLQVTDERRVSVDRSELASLPVQVILDADSDYALDGIPVHAETRLYEWRGRLFRELTDGDGAVNLNVEVLTQQDTQYLVSVPPTLIGNRRYRSAEPALIVISPGTIQLDPVTLKVIVENGRIDGRVGTASQMSGFDSGITILAIAQPSGLVYDQLLQADNTFSFDGLPLGEYLLTVHSEKERHQWEAQTIHLNLLDESAAEVEIFLKEKQGFDVQGRLINENGRPISFGWLAGPDEGYVGWVSPPDGRFVITGQDQGLEQIQATAPGYWSRTVSLDAAEEMEIILKLRPDGQTIRWGDGQITIPMESVVVNTDETLSLVRGWIWGRNDQPEPFLLNLEGAKLEAQAADFSLEYAPGETSWLYVNDGEVLFTSREGNSHQIRAGEMMAIGDGVPVPYPVAADDLVVKLFREGGKPTVYLSYETEPTTLQRLGDIIFQFGNNLSQIIVGATYLLMLVVPIVALLFGIRRLLVRRRI